MTLATERDSPAVEVLAPGTLGEIVDLHEVVRIHHVIAEAQDAGHGLHHPKMRSAIAVPDVPPTISTPPTHRSTSSSAHPLPPHMAELRLIVGVGSPGKSVIVGVEFHQPHLLRVKERMGVPAGNNGVRAP